jgi:probable H4MPT-linked C1 transfer pathway protein
MSNPITTLGLDMGGAHLKAALLDENGMACWVAQLPCPLWRGLGFLERALDEVMSRMAALHSQPHPHPRFAVTMTGELADIFSHRHDGVLQLAACAARYAAREDTVVYAGRHGFVGTGEVERYTGDIASTNWLTSAEFVAAHLAEGLFIDIGSTTTDLLAIDHGKVIAHGYSDAGRLRSQELVYTGVVRTPAMAVAQRIQFQGEWQGVAAEHFATMSDVYRLTYELDEAHDMADTADGAEKSVEASARRLARMVGCDLQDADMADWRQLANDFKQAQLTSLRVAAEAVMRQRVSDAAPLIGAGAGRFLVKQLAAQLQRPYVDMADLVQGDAESRVWAAVCTPAYAVAWLAQRSATWRH